MKKILLHTICFFFYSLIVNAQEDNSIPIRISSFDAAYNNNTNKLIWKTACSLDFANFEIERSYNGKDYTTINNFSADRLRCQQPFNFIDSNANQLAGRVFYRLKVADLDGRVYNSKIVSLITKGEGMEINTFTPTIVSSTANINISSSASKEAVISIINIQGKIISSYKIRLTKGVNSIPLNMDSLQPGKYWLKLNNNEELKTIQFMKQ